MGALYVANIMVCRFGQHYSEKRTINLLSNAIVFIHYGSYRQIMSALFGLILILFTGSGFRIDIETILISLFMGVSLVVNMYCNISALKSSTMALTSMFATAGLLVPVVAGIFLFGSPMKLVQWAGVLLFFAASYLIMGSSRKIYGKISLKTVLLLSGVLLSNGCAMLAQQMFTYYVSDGSVSVFSFLSFGLAGIALLIALPVAAKNTKIKPELLPKPLIIHGLILSVCIFVINQLATLATAVVPPVILFTFINGGSTIIAAITAALIYKERLSAKSVSGILAGIASLIIIKIF